MLKLYILIIEIVNIYNNNIFKQFDQNNEIIFIYPITSNNIIYITLTSSYQIENNMNKIIKEDVFNFTQYTRISLYNESDLSIISSYVQKIIYRIYNNWWNLKTKKILW